MTYTWLNKWSKQCFAVLTLSLLCGVSHAQPFHGTYYSPGGEDTILVEKQVSQKIPYHRLAKSLVKNLFNFNTENVLSFGEGKKDNVIRHFQDIAQRTKYRVNIDRDEVELKFTLNL